MSSSENNKRPKLSSRVSITDPPIITKTKAIMAGREDVMSLAQGVVHWAPPEASFAAVRASLQSVDSAVNQYGPTAGLPELKAALLEKLEVENGLTGVDLMVTAGANQAYTNVVLTLTDEGDRCVLFAPYYFNHLMAHQMTGGADRVSMGPCCSGTLHPDLSWLKDQLQGPDPPRMVTIVNPCNPTGVLLSKEEVQQAVKICDDAGAWLVLDNTYEHFVYGGREHYCASGPNVINIFSFSKAYGMMGWRMGYVAFPADGEVGPQMDKIQDTIPICPTQASMVMALGAVKAGRGWVEEHVRSLEPNRKAIIDALSPLGTVGNGVAGGEGAIYIWAKLPEGCGSDEDVMKWLVERHGVCVIPGSSCGCPGYIRVAFANMTPELCQKAANRLKAGLAELVEKQAAAVAS
eukprot:CAMPEP_0117669738 /NCGR_PEP_ID=MMETSP0804-20121206/12314_1 /TAXON_ID=1074897 /ORGANISM="Tetraselmis astigmatica, Strain CCMP880" /LENGTH=405 /DNA_ID=CAMNT_0005477859 /DNA_START=200 /DNA_END=1417 /DNA_ORIENTATION=-